MEAVQNQLKAKGFLKAVKGIILSKEHADVIKDCLKELDWALQAFDVAAQIGHAEKLAGISYAVDRVEKRVIEIHADLQRTFKSLPETATLPSASLPPPPEIIVGRDEFVEDLSERARRTSSALHSSLPRDQRLPSCVALVPLCMKFYLAC